MNNSFNILIIDSDASQALNLQAYLEKASYKATVANNGKTALTLCREQRIDLALVSLHLPDMPGYRLINEFYREAPDTEVVIIGGNSRLENAIGIVELIQVIGYIPDPLDTKRLLGLLHQSASRKRQAKVNETEGKYRGFFDDSVAAIYVFDGNQHFIETNQAGLDLLGYTRDELLTLKLKHVSRMEKAGLSIWERLLSGQKVLNFEQQLERKDGGIITVLSNAKPLKNAEGQIIGVQSILIDISKRKKAEDQIRQWKSRYEAVILSSDVMLFDWNMESDQITYGGDVENIVGRPIPEIGTGMKGFLQLVHPKDRDRLKMDVKQVAESHEKYSSEYCIRRHEECCITVEITSSFVAGRGAHNNRIVGFIKDITQRKKAAEEKKNQDAQLLYSQKMEAIGTLAGGIAHDFNNILQAIIGFSQVSLKQTPEGSKLYQNLSKIKQAGLRATALVKQILTFSRQNDRMLVPLDLSTVAKEVIALMRSTIPASIAIQQEFSPDLGTVLADPNQIHQVLMNLCTNAYHAMSKEQGTLTLTLSNINSEQVEIKQGYASKDNSYVRIGVTDTGYGIPPEIIDRIFDPYFTTKEKDEGTGLGLSVARGIVDHHHGQVMVESRPDEGTTFSVILPRIMNSPESAREIPALEIPGHERILVVDDEADIVEMLEQTLTGLGYRVTARTDSTNALASFRAGSDDYDLVLTDMTMPKMMGDELTRELRRIRPDIPVVLCTGYSERINPSIAKQLNIDSFLMKPVLREDLSRSIRQVLENRKETFPISLKQNRLLGTKGAAICRER